MRQCRTRIIALVSSICLSFSVFTGYNVKALTTTNNDVSVEQQMKDLLREQILNNNSGQSNENTIENSNVDPEEVVHVLVKLKGKAALDKTDKLKNAEKLEDDVISSQDEIINEVKKLTGVDSVESYGYLVNGFSIECQRKYIQEISEIKGVESAVESSKVKVNMTSSNKLTQAAQVWQDYGYKGEGMVISVIDTGTDVTHKDFANIDSDNLKLDKQEVEDFIKETGRGAYFSDKIPFGYNYVEENNDVKNADQDHGMHVAGIATANGSDTSSIKGVAPEAQLLAMKVAGSDGSFYLEDAIKAIEDSVKLGADVINMSFGIESEIGGSDNLFGQAITKATKAGVLCVYACGNSANSTSSNYESSPVNKDNLKDTSTVDVQSEEGFSVASMENVASSNYIKISGGQYSKEMQYSIVEGAGIDTLSSELEYVYCSLGKESDFTNLDVQGKVAVVDRGTITFSEKYKNALNNGAVGVIVINNENGIVNMSVEEKTQIPLLFIDKNDGEGLKTQIENGNNVFTLVKSDGSTVESKDCSISTYTSWGPGPDLDLKPEITAPGGNIYSTVNDNNYATYSGTSMSSPNIAGASALLIQSIKEKYTDVKGYDITRLARNMLMNTASPLSDKTSGIVYSPRQQGAGLVQLDNAIKTTVIATDSNNKASICLKNIGSSKQFKITLTNYGDKDVTYLLNDADLYTDTTIKEGVVSEDKIEGAKVKFNKSEVCVAAGKTIEVKGTLTLPDNFEKQNFVEGYITFNSEDKDNPNLSMPLLAFYGDYGDETIIDTKAADSENSLRSVTGLGQMDATTNKFTYYGEENNSEDSYGGYDNYGNMGYGNIGYGKVKKNINEDKVAFSPNDDEAQDYVNVATYFLRNAKDYTIEVLDKDKKVLGNKVEYTDVAKDSYYYYINYNGYTTYHEYTWDGTLYDQSTGKYKNVKDGQYYIRLTAKGYTDDAKEQTIDMPVKVDTVNPEGKIEDVKVTKSMGRQVCKISWQATDETSGIMDTVGIMFNDDSSTYQNVTDITESNGVYTATVSLSNNNYGFGGSQQSITSVDSVTLAIADNAGNITILSNGKGGDNIEVTDTEAPKITSMSYKEDSVTIVDKNTLNMSITCEDESATYGYIENFTTNDYNYGEARANGKISLSVGLQEGANLIGVFAQDEYGNISETKYFSVVYIEDKTKLSAGFVGVNGIEEINTTNNEDDILTVKGYVSQKPKVIQVNGDDVEVNDDMTFTKDVKLTQGVNKIKLHVEDNDGNVSDQSIIRIYYDSVAPTINCNDLGIEASNDGYIHVNDNNITISGTVSDNSSDYAMFINGSQVLSTNTQGQSDSKTLTREFSQEVVLQDGANIIKLEAIDKYGNKTEKEIKIALGDKAITDNQGEDNKDKEDNKDDDKDNKGDQDNKDNKDEEEDNKGDQDNKDNKDEEEDNKGDQDNKDNKDEEEDNKGDQDNKDDDNKDNTGDTEDTGDANDLVKILLSLSFAIGTTIYCRKKIS